MGWELFGWSFTVLRRNKRLMLFPIFSAAAALIAMGLSFLAWQIPVGEGVRQMSPRDLWWLAPVWLVTSFAMVFFNCALAACAQAQFSGERPTLRYGLEQAAGRVLPILGWALLSATVGLVLNAIGRRASWAGKGYPVLLPIAVTGFVVAMAALSAARGVFEVALYRYAAAGELPAGWAATALPGVFRTRRILPM